VDLTPSGGHKDKREIKQNRKKRWERKTKNGGHTRRNSKPKRTGKHEKPIRQAAADLGINENMLHRRIQQFRKAGA
jgi:hypothetical protein